MKREELRDQIKDYMEAIYNLKDDLVIIQIRLKEGNYNFSLNEQIGLSINYAIDNFAAAINALTTQLSISRSVLKYLIYYQFGLCIQKVRFDSINLLVNSGIRAGTDAIHALIVDDQLPELVHPYIERCITDLEKFMDVDKWFERKWT